MLKPGEQMEQILRDIELLEQEFEMYTTPNKHLVKQKIDHKKAELQKLQRKGVYTDSLFQEFKSIAEWIRRLEDDYGYDHPLLETAKFELKSFRYVNELHPLQISRMVDRLQIGGRHFSSVFFDAYEN